MARRKRYLYVKYDAYGREVESGLYSGTTAFASANVDDDAFPASGTRSERVVKAYDAMPSNSTFPFSTAPLSTPTTGLLGRLAAVASESGSPAEWRVGRFAYDARTELVNNLWTRTASDNATGAYEQVQRSYDRQGLVTQQIAWRVTSAGTFSHTQNYAYNARGLLASVATSSSGATGAATASFTYKPSGSLASKTLGPTTTPFTTSVCGSRALVA